MDRRQQRGRRLLGVAAVVGCVHGGASLYWAFGGRWLLNTVGHWAVNLADRSAVTAGWVLALIGLAKVAGAVIPILVEVGRVPGRRAWRIMEGCGAGLLLAWGFVNMVVGWAVVAGVVSSGTGYDQAAELGHAALWDPLFFLWGACLAVGLRLTPTPTTYSARS